ncbi:hypothetical protein [Kordia sp.]|uniref:hypothetical protein n=1 Tax=Kordia sp. TaxID=1965332 RepID=UPI003B5CE3E6
MKTYKNKKIYNFKVAQKRKKRTRAARIYWKSGSSGCRRSLNREYRTRCKVILRKKLAGQKAEFPLPKNTLFWYCD